MPIEPKIVFNLKLMIFLHMTRYRVYEVWEMHFA